ncbi:MAG TPA: universal stress protein UspA, partial [Tissierellales bacterium]|nr:universal stress protein UspA [Tissierellales bacterium]
FLNNDDDGEALEYLFQVSRKAGAELTVLRSKDVIKAMEDFGRNNYITHIIMGASPDEEVQGNKNITLNLKSRLSGVEFIIL